MSGLSRAAHIGVVIKGGDALERLASGRVLLFDKTGTLTQGRPALADVVTDGQTDPDEFLRLAASLDQVSAHVWPGRSAGLLSRALDGEGIGQIHLWQSQFCPDLAILAAHRVRAGHFWAPLYSDRGCSLCREIFSQPSANRIPDLLGIRAT